MKIMITCPECGKQVSSEATKCIHCGYPINQRVTVKETIVNSDSLPGANFSTVKKTKPNRKTKSIVIAVALILALAAGYFLVVSPMLKINSLKFPYGLTPEMNRSQATRAMNSNGFITDHTYGVSTYFLSREIFGHYTDSSFIYMNDEKLFSVTHNYIEKGYNSQNPGPVFQDVKKQLENQYGKPKEKQGYIGGTTYYWENGPYEAKIYFHTTDGFQVSYTYLSSKAK